MLHLFGNVSKGIQILKLANLKPTGHKTRKFQQCVHCLYRMGLFPLRIKGCVEEFPDRDT
jgi:hypothetical protein